MIPLTDKDYFEKTAILRATQGWKIEEQAERELAKNFKLYSEQVKREVADLYATHGVEGLLDYKDLRRKLTPYELTIYRNTIQELIKQIGLEDEELIHTFSYLENQQNMSILDSKMNILEAYGIQLVILNLNIVSKSLSGTYEETYKHTLYDLQRKVGYRTSYKRLMELELLERITDSAFGESPLEAIKNQRQSLMRDLKRTITKGIRRNETYSRLVKQVDKAVSGRRGFHALRTTLRNETDRIIAEAILEPYEQSGVSRYQYLATLDNRTTHTCISLDGNVYPIDEHQVGVNFPPMHFGCRSTVTAYIPEDQESEWKRTARDRYGNNYKVPGNITYKQWEQEYY